MLLMRAFTMPVMICGIAPMMVVMIWGSALDERHQQVDTSLDDQVLQWC